MMDEPRLIDLVVHIDDRGFLYEICHSYDLPEDKFGQVYLVGNPSPNCVRAFHRHQTLIDCFSVARGRAVFCLISPDEREAKRLVLDSKKPQLLIVPAGWWHGWMSLVSGTVLLSIGSELYDKEAPDEERVAPNYFDSLFGRNPWEIWAR